MVAVEGSHDQNLDIERVVALDSEPRKIFAKWLGIHDVV
jgi:hypothetical protein